MKAAPKKADWAKICNWLFHVTFYALNSDCAASNVFDHPPNSMHRIEVSTAVGLLGFRNS